MNRRGLLKLAAAGAVGYALTPATVADARLKSKSTVFRLDDSVSLLNGSKVLS